jgi:hypothetical protein
MCGRGLPTRCVASPLIFPRNLCEVGVSTLLQNVVFKPVARVSSGLLPPPFWMSLVHKYQICFASRRVTAPTSISIILSRSRILHGKNMNLAEAAMYPFARSRGDTQVQRTAL